MSPASVVVTWVPEKSREWVDLWEGDPLPMGQPALALLSKGRLMGGRPDPYGAGRTRPP